jgi:S1 RNA binding domain protein
MDEIKPVFNAGDEVEGEVSGITSFGAFVRLSNGEEGLVHISEIADTYVAHVEEFLKLKEKVKIKILGKNKKNKWELSIKQVGKQQLTKKNVEPMVSVSYPGRKKKEKSFEDGSIDDMIDKFLKKSEEVQLDVRRNLQYKQGVRKKGHKGKFG